MSACGRVALPPSLLPVAALLTMPLLSAALLAVGTDDARSVAESSAAGRTNAAWGGAAATRTGPVVDVHNTTCASGGAMDCSVLGYRSEWRVHTACSYVKREASHARLPVPAPHHASLRSVRGERIVPSWCTHSRPDHQWRPQANTLCLPLLPFFFSDKLK
jgi:hypothetical protein